VKAPQGIDLSFKSEKTSLHDKYSTKSVSGGDKRSRKSSNEDRRESNGLSLPELHKNEG